MISKGTLKNVEYLFLNVIDLLDTTISKNTKEA